MSELDKEGIIKHADERGLRRALIVTALALETRAVRAHLKHLSSVAGRHGHIYECGEFAGTFGTWLIVVAESGAGTHPAQSVVTSAHMDFEYFFETAIFSGIAGSRKPEATIGSVVVSNKLHFPYTGKYSTDQGFTSRPETILVDQWLVGRAVKVARDGEWQSRIRPPLRGKLPEGNSYPQPFPPEAFIAPIASIEAVLADPDSDLEKIIAKHYSDTFAVEMEGYGAARAALSEKTPLIVVRGISDLRSGKTSENDLVYQPVAAAHAAAFSFELLDTWSRFQSNKRTPLHSSPTVENGQKPNDSVTNLNLSTSDSPVARSKIVLNFAGTLNEFSQEKIDNILNTIRTITNDTSVTVVGIEDGSFRLIIEAHPSAVSKIDTPETFETLSKDLSVSLLGVLDERDYRETLRLEKDLQRASRDLLYWPQALPDGSHFDRPELSQLLSIIEANESSTTAVLGAPGSGKSALLAALGNKLIERGMPFLAIKADLLDPSIQTEEALIPALGLPVSVSLLLLKIADLRPIVLLIDQLDALAGYVDLRTGRLNVLLNLVKKVSGRRNIHVVLSSRIFEFEHDSRLKTVRAESLTLALPPWSAVLQVLESYGVQAVGWPVDAQELLRTPQALATFLKFKNVLDQPPFQNYQAMLDQFWKEEVLAKPNGPRISELAGVIAEGMAEKESLWLAAAKFDLHAQDLDALIASGILTDFNSGRGRIGFSHQTVFEHVLARSFARNEGWLSTFVRERQPSLFVRPKLWAALTYLRGVETNTYNFELHAVWNIPGLRLHLKNLLIEFVGQQSTPTTTEILLMEKALNSSDRRVALQAMRGSPGWLDRFRYTHLASAMRNKDEVDLAAALLDKAWAFAPETVTSLIEKFWLPEQTFDHYTWTVLQESTSWTDLSVRMAKTVLERTDMAPHAFERLISVVGVDQPEIALELVSARLLSQLERALKESDVLDVATLNTPREGEDSVLSRPSRRKPNRLIVDLIEQQDGWEELEALARANPELLLKYVWPWFSRALKALVALEQDSEWPGFPLQHQLDLRLPQEHSLGLPEPPLLGAIVTALESLASNNPENFLGWLAIHEHENATPAQRMFAHALASQPERLAERSAKFLLNNVNRFHLGSSEDESGTTKRLVKSASPFWKKETLATFEQAVLCYSHPLPSNLKGRDRLSFLNIIRRTKLKLLDALPSDRTSEKTRRTISEERRRFPKSTTDVVFQGPTWIGSPISSESICLASDEDILNAFRRLPDISGWDHPKNWGKGGNIQLAREFAEFAKTNPERAIRIIKRFDPSIGTRASGYALTTLAETAESVVLFDLIKNLDERGFQGEEFRSSAARAVERLVERKASISDSMLDILKAWLSETNGGPSAEDSLSEKEGELPENADEESKASGSVLWGLGSLSVLPQGSYPLLEAITLILLHRYDYDALLAVYQRHLEVNDDPRVWQSLLKFFQYMRPADPDTLANFIFALFARYPELVNTQEVAVLLANIHWQIPGVVHKSLLRWRYEKRGKLQQTYGELVALVALVQPALLWPKSLMDEIVKSDQMGWARVGAAYTAVNLWDDERRRDAASRVLQSIIPKADEFAWTAIFDLFRLVDEITPEEAWVSLLEAIAANISKIERIHSSFVVERLQTLLPHQASLVVKIARGLVEKWGGELGDLRTRTAGDAPALVDLAITVHRLGPETREAGTSLFEDLLLVNTYSARETLQEIDNRFGNTLKLSRPRLPRRARRSLSRFPNKAKPTLHESI